MYIVKGFVCQKQKVVQTLQKLKDFVIWVQVLESFKSIASCGVVKDEKVDCVIKNVKISLMMISQMILNVLRRFMRKKVSNTGNDGRTSAKQKFQLFLILYCQTFQDAIIVKVTTMWTTILGNSQILCISINNKTGY